MEPSEQIERFGQQAEALRDAVGRVVVGQHEVVDEVLVCLFAGGHALLEGAPGLGKTLLVRTLSRALDLRFSRIQFTPDLMPSDITGTNMVVEDPNGQKRFELSRGPIFGQLVLADEINRATPKTQSALLEAMAERSVTIAGHRHDLAPPFFVLATENPIEMEGTYPLPEAQLDRFLFKVLIPAPDEDTLVGILERTTGNADPDVPVVMHGDDVLRMRELVRASDPEMPGCAASAKRWLRYGAGVRGAQSLILAAKASALMRGRAHISFEDLRRVAKPALRHRLIPNFEAEADSVSTDTILDTLLDEVSEAPPSVAALVSG